MRNSLTGLDDSSAHRLQLATLPLVLQFIWTSTQHGLEGAFFATLASYVIFASLLPSTLVVWWLIRRAQHFLGKSASPKTCSRTTLLNWVVALSAGSSIILHVPYVGFGFIAVYFAALASIFVFALLWGLDLLIQLGDRLRLGKNV